MSCYTFLCSTILVELIAGKIVEPSHPPIWTYKITITRTTECFKSYEEGEAVNGFTNATVTTNAAGLESMSTKVCVFLCKDGVNMSKVCAGLGCCGASCTSKGENDKSESYNATLISSRTKAAGEIARYTFQKGTNDPGGHAEGAGALGYGMGAAGFEDADGNKSSIYKGAVARGFCEFSGRHGPRAISAKKDSSCWDGPIFHPNEKVKEHIREAHNDCPEGE